MSDEVIGGPCKTCGQQGIFNCCEPEPETVSDEMFRFSDFAPFVTFESLGRAVRHMDRIMSDWREKADDHVGSLVCLAMGVDTSDKADIKRMMRLKKVT